MDRHSQPSPAADDLMGKIRSKQAETMVENARLILERPVCDQTRAEAGRQVRMAMYAAAFGQIPDTVRREILELLCPLCPEIFVCDFRPAETDWGVRG